MKTVRRLFNADIVSAVAFVAVAFLSLFFFIDFVDELGDVGGGTGPQRYTALAALVSSLLQIPGHLYELAPIAVLIGTIYALSRMAQSSEFTILRTGGLGPGRALQLLATLGLVFGVLTFVVGDYVAPLAEQQAVQLRASMTGGLSLGRTGAWLKDKRSTPAGERSYAVNVGSAGSDGTLLNIRIFEFDADGRLLQRIAARSGRVDAQATWQLSGVTLSRWPDTLPPLRATGGEATDSEAAASAADTVAMNEQVAEQTLASHAWPSSLSGDVVAAAVLPVSTMSTAELRRYIQHLSSNEQAAQQQMIQFWKRAFYPFACLVMVALALPFAYLHARSGGISLKMFGGIMLGISFVLLNNVAGHLGMLRNWTPWVVAAGPSVIYLMLSLAAFAWLVRFR